MPEHLVHNGVESSISFPGDRAIRLVYEGDKRAVFAIAELLVGKSASVIPTANSISAAYCSSSRRLWPVLCFAHQERAASEAKRRAMVVTVLGVSLGRTVTCRVATKDCTQKSDVVSWVEFQPDTRSCQRVGRAATWQVGFSNIWPAERAVDESGRCGAYEELVIGRDLANAKRASAAELLLNISRKQTKCRSCIDVARVGKGRY